MSNIGIDNNHNIRGSVGPDNMSNSNNINVSIDNLSTLRSSDVNERERNLLEKIKNYKAEN